MKIKMGRFAFHSRLFNTNIIRIRNLSSRTGLYTTQARNLVSFHFGCLSCFAVIADSAFTVLKQDCFNKFSIFDFLVLVSVDTSKMVCSFS